MEPVIIQILAEQLAWAMWDAYIASTNEGEQAAGQVEGGEGGVSHGAADFKKWAEELYKRLSVRLVMDEAASVILIAAALAQVRAEERERCAKVAEATECFGGRPSDELVVMMMNFGMESVAKSVCRITTREIAAAIRAQETSDAK